MKPPPGSPESKRRRRVIYTELLLLEAEMEGITLKQLIARKVREAITGISQTNPPIWAVRADELCV